MLFETRENKQNSDTLKAKSGSLQTDIFEGGGGGGSNVVYREWGYKINYVLP